jgi:Ribbon-helix-helix protein, copG family
MRTTIKLDDEILIEAKAIAARTGRTFAEVVEDAVREAFARRRAVRPTSDAPVLPTFGAGGLRPGVDLDDSVRLLDTMDGTDH